MVLNMERSKFTTEPVGVTPVLVETKYGGRLISANSPMCTFASLRIRHSVPLLSALAYEGNGRVLGLELTSVIWTAFGV